MRTTEKINKDDLITKYGEPFSSEIGIDLRYSDEGEVFKWFLASFLYGKRISYEIAARTYKIFEQEGLISPESILKAGWDKIVEILDKGGYARYDFSTADRIIEIMKELNEKYEGRISNIQEKAFDSADLEKRLMEFKGVGRVTANIFLRELRPYWLKANPEPLDFVREEAQELGINIDEFDRSSEYFTRLEAALIRYSKINGAS